MCVARWRSSNPTATIGTDDVKTSPHHTNHFSVSAGCGWHGWWLMTGAGLFGEKSTAGWLRLVASGWFVLREKYCWLVADNPSEPVPTGTTPRWPRTK
jgi:hypothetical protein